jgi:PAS domain S-box-containing protein
MLRTTAVIAPNDHLRALSPVDLGFAGLFAHMADAIFVAEAASARIVLWNAAAEALFGYSVEEALALMVDALVPGQLSQGQGIDARAPLELQARSKDGAELFVEVTLTPIENPPVGGRYVLALARDVTERVRTRVREAAAVRVAGKIRADASPERLLDDLLEEAVAIVGGDAATVYGWDDGTGGLVVVRNSVRTLGEYVPSAQGTVGRAADRRAPVIVNDYQHEPGMVTSTLRAGVRAAIAVPLLYEGRLLGALGVVTYSAEKRFATADTEVLELLAAVAASVLVGLERARLEGALLSARTSAHELGNTLAGLIGQAQLLRRDRRLPEDMVARTDVIVQKAYEAAAKVVRLQNLKALRETRWGTAGTTIDLSPEPYEPPG